MISVSVGVVAVRLLNFWCLHEGGPGGHGDGMMASDEGDSLC